MTAYLVIGGALFVAMLIGFSIGNSIADAFDIDE
jgi:hypothetical protein